MTILWHSNDASTFLLAIISLFFIVYNMWLNHDTVTKCEVMYIFSGPQLEWVFEIVKLISNLRQVFMISDICWNKPIKSSYKKLFTLHWKLVRNFFPHYTVLLFCLVNVHCKVYLLVSYYCIILLCVIPGESSFQCIHTGMTIKTHLTGLCQLLCRFHVALWTQNLTDSLKWLHLLGSIL